MNGFSEGGTMTATHPACDPSRLQGLLDDSLLEEEERALLEHLGTCAACQRDIERLAAEGPWWDNLRRYAPREDPAAGGPDSYSLHTVEAAAADARRPAEGDDVSLAFLAPSDDPRFLGRLGRYEVTGVVGRGGMGLVLKAADPPLNRYVAIKVLAPELATSGPARKRFAREAKAAAAIAHEHVVPIFAVDEAGGLPYLVMPYVAGRSLRERIEREGPLGLAEALRVGMQTALGLAAAHAQGLVHRDVKPANILMEEGVERVKLTDFGLARAVDDASVTQSGVVTGTPEYMSPEQARGEPTDHRSDLFSLGGVLYAMCTGHAPFRAGTSLAVLRRVCEDRHRPIRDSNPGLPGWLEEVVDRLLAKDPADRFPTAAEVADLLGRHLARVQNPSLPPVEHCWVKPRPAGRGRRRWSAKIAPTLLVASLVAAWLSGTSENPPARGVPGATGGPGEEARAGLPSEPDPDRLEAEFYQDFRKAKFDNAVLKVARWNTERLFRPEPTGLRVMIPASKGKMYQVGIAPRFRVQGDFEITTSYEVLKADPARDGYGLGFNLVVEADSPEKVSLVLENSDVPPKPEKGTERPGRFFNATLITGPPDGRKYSPGPAPAKTKAGKLRITRVGPTVCAWYSEDGTTFRVLRQVEFGTEDLSEVLIGANAGGSGHALEVLIQDLRVRAEELPGYAGSHLAPSKTPLRVVAIGAGILLVACLSLWWIAASRRRAGHPSAKAKGPRAGVELAPPDVWDEEGLRLLEEKARAYADGHPNAGAFAERPRFHFTLHDGAMNGPFTAWHEVDPAAARRLGKTWDEVRKRLPVRFEGEYRAGKRHGAFVCRDESGEAVERRYRGGERVA